MNLLLWTPCRIRLPLLGGVLLLLLLGTAGAQEPSAKDDAAAAIRRKQLVAVNRLGEQARQFQQAGLLAKAIQAMEDVLAIEQEVFGAVHGECAGTLGWIASLEETRGDHAAARRRLEEALEIQTRLHGTGNWRVTDARRAIEDLNRQERLTPEERGQLREARSLYLRVADLYHAGRYSEAIPHAERSLAIRRSLLGVNHPDCASSLNNLALLYTSMGEFAMAEPLYRQALEIHEKALGEDHPSYATSLGNLAVVHESLGEFAKAEPLCRQALEIKRRILDTTFAVLSERQQFQMSRLFRGTLDSYLSLSSWTAAPPAEAHEPLLAWKGAVFARQARDRLHTRDPGSAALLAELESTSRRLAALSYSVPGKTRRAAWRHQLGELTEKREELERALSRMSEAYREVRATERLTPAELQKSLPASVTLVDVMEYSRSMATEKDGRRTFRKERHLVAFRVPADGEIDRVDLGPAAPIAAAIESWRAGIQRQNPGKAGEELRGLLWEPLANRIGEADTILLSPDGALNRLPLVALPGKTLGTYLLEEISVAVVPVPRLLPGLLSRPRQTMQEESLLVLGDVDYGGLPGRDDGSMVAMRSAPGTVTGALPGFGKLDATGTEITAIRDCFEARHADGEVRLLGRAEATEAAFRSEAGKHQWLHLATHGFFAPVGLQSALAGAGDERMGMGKQRVTGYHPGVLSGLALSGANTPPESDGDDGILTALEVAALDLSKVEVAVLSACETGLGEVAGGEGVLGLQRAFQVAGVRTTVTSLWKVPDEATRLLMQRFYENIWDRKLPKLEALREAQLWLMHEGRARLMGGDGKRGVRIPGEDEGAGERSMKLPPFYWAAFVLSGDWR